MAQLYLDSFDHYADADKTSKWNQWSGGGNGGLLTVTAAVGARGTSALAFLPGGNSDTRGSGFLYLYPTNPSPSGATCITGFRFKSTTAFTNVSNGTSGNGDSVAGNSCPSGLFACRSGGSTLWWSRINASGQIQVYRGATLLYTSAFLTQNVYQYIEIKVLLSATVGTVEVKIDGVSSGSTGSLNTTNTGAVTWDEVRLGSVVGVNSTAGIPVWYLDDFYLCDGSGADGWTDFKGDMAIYATYPNAAGNYSDFTRSTGADQWATIDEASANGATDYNSSSTLNAKDTLNFPAAPVTGGTILGIQVVCQVSKTDAGSAGHKAMTRISATDYTGTENGVPSSYAFKRQCWGVSPATGVAWTEAEYNAAEFGYTKST